MRATFYIGIEYDRNGVQLDAAKRAQGMADLRLLAVQTFGGYTLIPCEGSDGGKPEATARLEVVGDLDYGTLRSFAVTVGRLFNQGSVLVWVEHSASVPVAVPVNDPRHSPGIMTPGPMLDECAR